MKKMIFHIPMHLEKNGSSGSEIRPIKMIQAFKNIGYDVDVVMGYVADRKKQIREIKQNIEDGIEYDFLYSESSTMPTALTEKHHLPVAPFLDFNFFGFCKRYNIKIGLFYRDVYWVFDEYKKKLPFFKQKLAMFFYRYDLKNYQKYIDTLYLPSRQMFEHIPFEFNKKIAALYPAIEEKRGKSIIHNDGIDFIYVGGLSSLYDLTLFSKIISDFEKITFNLCTREDEWSRIKHYYEGYKIDPYHLNGDALANIYQKSDIAVYFIKPDVLWSFAMGVKLFEYIAYRKPIIAVKNTAVGDFVEKNDIGWTIDYEEDELKSLITDLQNNPSQIEQKIKNIEKIIPQNTWEVRALQVARELH